MTSLPVLPSGRPHANGPAPRPIVLSSHPGQAGVSAPRIQWGGATPALRGPVVATVNAGVDVLMQPTDFRITRWASRSRARSRRSRPCITAATSSGAS